MFPRVGSKIFTEPGSPEDFHVMEVKNVSRDEVNVAGFGGIASGNALFLKIYQRRRKVRVPGVAPPWRRCAAIRRPGRW